jgi:hypothetical protein
LLGDHETVAFVTNDEWRLQIGDFFQSRDRVLDHSPFTDQGQKLLRIKFTDNGQSLVPDPPDSITGSILFVFFFMSDS